jgi:hypothetical protein
MRRRNFLSGIVAILAAPITTLLSFRRKERIASTPPRRNGIVLTEKEEFQLHRDGYIVICDERNNSHENTDMVHTDVLFSDRYPWRHTLMCVGDARGHAADYTAQITTHIHDRLRSQGLIG